MIRKRFGEAFSDAFVQVLQVARENQLSKFGTASLDGSKIHAHASRHSAFSHGHIEKIETQLKAEVQEMLKLAEAADPDDFTRWIFPHLFHSRIPRYEAIARPHGYTVTSHEVGQVRDEKDFLALLETAIAR